MADSGKKNPGYFLGSQADLCVKDVLVPKPTSVLEDSQ